MCCIAPSSCNNPLTAERKIRLSLIDNDYFSYLRFPFILFTVSFEDSEYEIVPLTAEKVLELIEQAYPNPVTPEDLAQ